MLQRESKVGRREKRREGGREGGRERGVAWGLKEASGGDLTFLASAGTASWCFLNLRITSQFATEGTRETGEGDLAARTAALVLMVGSKEQLARIWRG